VTLEEIRASLVALDLPGVGESEPPDRGSVVRVRDVMRDALADDEMLIDCIDQELRSLAYVFRDLLVAKLRDEIGDPAGMDVVAGGMV